MYQIKYDGALLYDPRVESLLIDAGSCRMAVNEAGSMELELNGQHPFYDRIAPRQGVVELLSDGVTLFRGRVLKSTYDFYNRKTVTVEGLLACLNDSIIPPFAFPADWSADADYQAAAESGNVVEYFLTWVLSQHNAQVTAAQQIKLGTVTVRDSNNYLYRSAESYNTAWTIVKDKLFDSALGGNLLVRYASDGVYVDYVATLPLTNTQPIAFGENLLDLTDEADTTDTYTAILPVGAYDLTIADLSDGDLTDDLVKEGLIIYSKSARDKYGRITAVETWEDVTEAENLRTKAAAMLAQTGVKLTETVTVTAVDLGLVEDDIAQFRAGRMCEVRSAPHGLSDTYPLTALELDLVAPENTRLTLGVSVLSLSERQRDDIKGVNDAIELQQGQIEDTQQQISGVYEEVSVQITQAIQTSREIIFSALEDYALTSDLETLQATISAQLSVLAGEVDISITDVRKQITDVQGDLQEQVDSITKYFRFTADGLYIGEEGNELLLRVDNGIIGFYDGGLQVAYFTDKQLVVTDANFLNSLQIGKFAFVPRNSGNLSLIKVGD